MKVDLKNRTAIVCGSTQGIGKAIAEKFAENGCNLILISRNEKLLSKISNEIAINFNINCSYITADFENSKSLQFKLNSFFKKNLSNVDILVNNVRGPVPSTVQYITGDNIHKVIEKHLVCNQILVNMVLKKMIKKKYGRIINIVDTIYHTPYPGLALSSVRASEISWSKALSFEIAKHGITVNNILPGPTETAGLKKILSILAKKKGISFEKFKNEVIDSVPLKRFALPSEIANVALFLASDEASFITGTNIRIDGGFTPSIT